MKHLIPVAAAIKFHLTRFKLVNGPLMQKLTYVALRLSYSRFLGMSYSRNGAYTTCGFAGLAIQKIRGLTSDNTMKAEPFRRTESTTFESCTSIFTTPCILDLDGAKPRPGQGILLSANTRHVTENKFARDGVDRSISPGTLLLPPRYFTDSRCIPDTECVMSLLPAPGPSSAMMNWKSDRI